MSNLLPREFNFRHEILPVAVVGILLNLVVHFLVDKQTRFLFADMSGTAVAAMLLGPWWAATVGILSSAITGSFYSSYFPFGVVNIMGGLAWGYAARVPWIKSAISQGWEKSGARIVYAYFVLVIVGGITCGIFSSITKLILYSNMDLPLHSNQAYYLNAFQLAGEIGITRGADIVGLFGADIVRDLLDKSLVVLLAILFVQLIGFIPAALGTERDPHVVTNRASLFRTDAFSILCFSLTYTFFLLIARLAQPVINIRNAPRSIYWLQNPLVLALLYTPILLAVISFLILSYTPRSVAGRRMDARRKRRSALYRLLAAPRTWSSSSLNKSELFALLRSDGVYGLLGTAVLWPSKGLVTTGPVNSVFIYFSVMAIFAVFFFYQRREFTQRFCQSNSWLMTLKKWLRVPARTPNPEPMLRMFAQILEGNLVTSQGKVLRHNRVAYLLGIITSEQGYLSETRRSRSSDRVLLIIPDEPGTISGKVPEDVAELLENTGAKTAIILTTSARIVDQAALQWLRNAEHQNQKILVLGREDIENAIYDKTRIRNVDRALANGRINAIASLAPDEGDTQLPTEFGFETLSRRSLPYLRHLLETLPKGSLVLDLGAGRGRHTISALKLGHRVVAVERNSKSCEEFTAFVNQSGEDRHSELRCEDYLETLPETVGYVDLAIITGVLQHTVDIEDLRNQLRHVQNFVVAPNSMIYIEMLFEMKFNGQPPSDGRFNWTQPLFEEILESEFPETEWRVELARGPIARNQSFESGLRSFLPPAKLITSTSAEYLVVREV